MTKHSFQVGDYTATMRINDEGQPQIDWATDDGSVPQMTPETHAQFMAGQDAFWHRVIAAQGYVVGKPQ